MSQPTTSTTPKGYVHLNKSYFNFHLIEEREKAIQIAFPAFAKAQNYANGNPILDKFWLPKSQVILERSFNNFNDSGYTLQDYEQAIQDKNTLIVQSCESFQLYIKFWLFSQYNFESYRFKK